MVRVRPVKEPPRILSLMGGGGRKREFQTPSPLYPFISPPLIYRIKARVPFMSVDASVCFKGQL